MNSFFSAYIVLVLYVEAPGSEKSFLSLLSAVEIFGWLLLCVCSSQSTGASEFWEVYVHSELTPRVFLKSKWKHKFYQTD